MSNDSYDHAEEYVLAVLARECFEVDITSGTEIKIDGMGHCDCIPIYVLTDEMDCIGRWDLVSIANRRPDGLYATYRFNKGKRGR